MSTTRPHIGDAKQGASESRSESVSAEQVRALIEPVCDDAGYELVEVEFGRGGAGYRLRLYIDYPEGSEKSISFANCESVSREVSALLDVEDLISSRYDLEVSSPGIDRPLRTDKHFRRFLGSEVKVSLIAGLQGRRNYKGVLLAVSEDGHSITVDVDGAQTELSLADVASARLIPDWSALMKGQGKKA